MSTDKKISKARLLKMIKLRKFLCNMLRSLGNIGNELGEKVIRNLPIPLANYNLLELVKNLAILFASNEDMHDIIKII